MPVRERDGVGVEILINITVTILHVASPHFPKVLPDLPLRCPFGFVEHDRVLPENAASRLLVLTGFSVASGLGLSLNTGSLSIMLSRGT
jgi:hypothetical protein